MVLLHHLIDFSLCSASSSAFSLCRHSLDCSLLQHLDLSIPFTSHALFKERAVTVARSYIRLPQPVKPIKHDRQVYRQPICQRRRKRVFQPVRPDIGTQKCLSQEYILIPEQRTSQTWICGYHHRGGRYIEAEILHAKSIPYALL